ncbi:MAG: M20/M25/M40 family metallo-hydrolase [Gammaproteobacteria bacterium]|nr:M20/M25/M40 family metallo-hydrolase [Gammaproteobacteria bacterium]
MFRPAPCILPALLTLAIAPTCADTQVDSSTAAIAAHVDASQEAAFALLERAVNINSGTFNPAGVRRVGDLFRAEFDALGFATEWVDGASFGRAGHLVARRGERGPHVLLIGHLDTVFEPDSPFQKFERDGDIALGPGTSDMKGGIVIMLSALRALMAMGSLDELTATVVLTGDEEDVGEPQAPARAALLEAADGADIAIGLENADDNPATAVIARRSSTSWTLKVNAPGAHSSQIFRDNVGAGAIFESARILEALRSKLAGEDYLTFNPGIILGGAQTTFDPGSMSGTAAGKGNIIAPTAVVIGDLRALTIPQREQAKMRMTEIVAAHLPRASTEITFQDSYPPLAPTDGNRKLLALYDQVSRDLGFGPVTAVDPRDAGAADISFVGGVVPMALDGLGLLGGGNRTEGEFADLRTFRIQTQRLALLLYRLSRR